MISKRDGGLILADIVIGLMESRLIESDNFRVYFHDIGSQVSKSAYKNRLERLSQQSNVYYKLFKYRLFVFGGDYGRLNTLGYSNATNARRDIQARIRNVTEDLQMLQDVFSSTIRSEVYQSSSNANKTRTNEEFIPLIKIVEKRKDVLQAALLSPNVSYRAYPHFSK